MRKRKILEISVPSDNLVTRFSPTFHPPLPSPCLPSIFALSISLSLFFTLTLSLFFALTLSLFFALALSLSRTSESKRNVYENMPFRVLPVVG